MAPQLGKLLWQPSNPDATRMSRFRKHISERYSVQLDDYAALHAWSIANVEHFWVSVWEYCGVVSSRQWDEGCVLERGKRMAEVPAWFKGARLNWAENILARQKDDSKLALIEAVEPLTGYELSYTRVTWGELREKVRLTSLALRRLGLEPGNVLGYYGPTSIASVVLFLAASSVGAIWSSTASDFGPAGVLERFRQFGNSLFAVVGVQSVVYNGKRLPQRTKLEEVIEGLQDGREKALEVIVFDFLREGLEDLPLGWRTLDQLELLGAKDDDSLGREMVFEQLPFDHPWAILFSSGTTGKPKAIVHRQGHLLQQLKEHTIHGDMDENSVFFQYTTPGWMMFQYLVSGLCSGGTVVLFDGSPLANPSVLWRLADDLAVTVFGTSAKYLEVLAKNYSPKEHHKFDTLRQVLSTGSPLGAEQFTWVYEHVKSDLLLGSITGGTDICSLFAGHNAALPVYQGELQSLGLGMAVEAWSEDGKRVPAGEQGELVCVKAFPAMPVMFWNDPDGAKYQSSYFERFAGAVWVHGDLVTVTESRSGNGGGLVVSGRSDSTLNPSGVRIGTAELYELMATFSPSATPQSPLNVVLDSLAVGQKIDNGLDERVILFVKLVDGHSLDAQLEKEIKLRIRTGRSARHVPARIIQVSDIPYTTNGKLLEVGPKKIINGVPLSSINFQTIRNPEVLAEYSKLGEILRKEVS